jgi:fructosamine-3-kinase
MNDDIVKKIFDDLNLDVINLGRIKTLSNYVYKVKTNKGNYYLKIYVSDSKKAFKLANLYDLLSKNGVLVPSVLKYDESCSLIKHPFLVLSEVQGDLLVDVFESFSRTNLERFYYDFGRVVGKIHSIKFDKFGECFDGKTVEGYSFIDFKGPFDSWKDFFMEIIKKRLGVLKNSELDDLVEPMRSWFESKLFLLDFDVMPSLIHEDLNQKNVFVKNGVVSGVIDFDDSFIGHNEEELMRLEGANFSNDSLLKDSFFKGYTEIINLDEGYEKRRIIYYLSRLLVHIRCVLEFREDYVGDASKEIEIMRAEIKNIIDGKGTNFDKNDINT